MSKYTEAIEVLKRNKPTSDPRECGRELCNAVDVAITTLSMADKSLAEFVEALQIADRLEQADAQAHYLDRMRQTTKRAGYSDGYIQAVKDIRGDNNDVI